MTHTDTSHEQDLKLLVRQTRWESDGVMSVLLENADGGPLPDWEPGAHLDVHLPGGLLRQYSLNGDPADTTTWRIAVLREENGRGGSAAVHDSVRPGMVLDGRGPRNNFRLEDAPAYLFVAGGIGVTPILPMAAAAAARGATVRTVYGGRRRASMAFLDDVERHDHRIVPEDEDGLIPLAEEIAGMPEGALVYACGPEPLLQAITQATEHLPEGTLHLERFAAVEPTAEELAEDHAFEVVAAQSGVTVTVPADASIVHTLEAAGVPTETSCEQGICGTCETPVLEGEPVHRDSLLSDAERAANDTMMICVGRCAGTRLVLDI